MPAMLQNNSANAPTPDAENAFGGTLRKSSSEYSSQSEESCSEQESSSSEDEQEENRLTPSDDIQGQTSVPESDCGEKDTDAMDKNSPEPTDTQIKVNWSLPKGQTKRQISHTTQRNLFRSQKSKNQVIDLSC